MNLENYETVKERKNRLQADHKNFSICVNVISPLDQIEKYVAVKAFVWKDYEDRKEGKPANSEGLSLSLAGGLGADKNAWVENCEESAIGRALDNMGYHGNNKCSRDEMEKAIPEEERQPVEVLECAPKTKDAKGRWLCPKCNKLIKETEKGNFFCSTSGVTHWKCFAKDMPKEKS